MFFYRDMGVHSALVISSLLTHISGGWDLVSHLPSSPKEETESADSLLISSL